MCGVIIVRTYIIRESCLEIAAIHLVGVNKTSDSICFYTQFMFCTRFSRTCHHVKSMESSHCTLISVNYEEIVRFYSVHTRPGNIRVFMYPGRVCNFRAGTRVPASPRLAQKSTIFCGKNKLKTKFVETIAYLKARSTKTIN